MGIFRWGEPKLEIEARRARDREDRAWSEGHGPGHAARIARAQREADEARYRADRAMLRRLSSPR